MEPQSYSSSSSITTSYPFPEPQAIKPNQLLPLPKFRSALHSVRRLPAKPWKKPIAPLLPTPPQVYEVDSADFKQVVQKLTAAPAFQSRRLQCVAPPPLSLLNNTMSNSNKTVNVTVSDTGKAETATLELLPSPNITTPLALAYRELMSDPIDIQPPWKQQTESLAMLSPFGFGLSPTAHMWSSFLSPGTLSSLEQSTAL